MTIYAPDNTIERGRVGGGCIPGVISTAGRGVSVWGPVGPGIGFGGTSEYFSNAVGPIALIISVGEDQVLDFIGKIDSGANNQYLYFINAYTAAGGGWYWRTYVQAANPTVELSWKAADGTAVVFSKVCPVQPVDDNVIHHWRVTFDHDGNATAYIDNTAAAAVSVAALAAKDIPSPNCYIGSNEAGNFKFWGVMYSLTADQGAAVLSKTYIPYGHATVTGIGDEWRFEESSGDIVGTYATITCADNGTPTYGVPV